LVSQAYTVYLTFSFFLFLDRTEIPFVFEVPTTLEALHDMIGNYASTGNDASVIIQRIYASNSIRLDRRNGEKMQNFYDVLLRRFVAVADAIHQSGDGGVELGRFKQLDALTKTMYAMAQDSSDGAGSIWSRRLGIFQNAHAKRLRDAELERDEEEDDVFSAWPSVGVVLTLKALGHIFPVTDQRHHVVTPAVLLLGQMVAQTPVLSTSDVVLGTLCSGLLIDYTREAKRVAPEAHAFLAGVIRLFANDAEEREGSHPLPSLSAAAGLADIASFRSVVSQFKGKSAPLLSLEKSAMEGGDTPVALLFAALSLVERLAENLAGAVSSAEKELLAEITDSLLALKPASKAEPLPTVIKKKIASAAAALSEACELEARAPIQRKSGPTLREKAIKSLAPRLENPDKYSLSRDKGKSSIQAATDRTRREYRREHKAVARELRLDGAFIENERRSEQDKKDSAARAKRNKNFAWMESEQGAMNQQVRLGGELLKGGGTGAARAKVASAQMGIKKGGKF
jgi:nucleolar protein 14